MAWHYPRHQYEIGLLHTLVRSGFAANRYVHYAGNFADCASEAEFRVGDEVVRVVAAPGEPPALWTDGAAVEARVPGSDWLPTRRVEGGPDVRPHREPEPLVDVPLTLVDGLWVAELPVLGRPVFACDGVPVVRSGESRDEALADLASAETRHDLVQLPDRTWTTEHALGFRYLRVEPQPAAVTVRASRRPTPRRGRFACSDPTLTRIWEASAATLHACMHGLMLDGIKRDRMPWIGDQALNTLANAYAFGDRDIVTASLTALGRPKDGYVNGIADYSLWWLIGTGFLARHFDAGTYVADEADHIDAFTARLAEQAGHDGLFRPVPSGDDFQLLVFIDWGVNADATRDVTALQVLWFWALRTAAELLGSVGHPGAGRWAELAETVRETLRNRGWDEGAGQWREYVDGVAGPSPYPAFLAVLAGLGAEGSVGELLARTERAGTPFMTGFLLRALVEIGRADLAVARIRTLWGGMLDAGAVTFWEEFGGDGSDHAMYGRAWGKSLCHAWASGPAALLPEAVLGVRSLADGWRRFEVSPRLGELEWAEATIPAPQGDIVVRAGAEGLVVEVPAGSVLAGPDGDHEGPCVVRSVP